MHVLVKFQGHPPRAAQGERATEHTLTLCNAIGNAIDHRLLELDGLKHVTLTGVLQSCAGKHGAEKYSAVLVL
jgi:hypothetical protein